MDRPEAAQADVGTRVGPPAGQPARGAPEPVGIPPSWCAGANGWTAFRRGQAAALSVPAIILFSTMLGFGALARDTGFTLGHALFMTGSIFALPAQVALVDELGRGATIAAAAFAVMLTSVRLLPMTVVLMPYLRQSNKTPQLMTLAASHFIAITAWVEGQRRLPVLPVDLRLPFYLGLGTTLLLSTMIGTATGFVISAQVPVIISATLLFLTPIYFILSLFIAAGGRTDIIAIMIGGMLGPVLHLLAPSYDLLLTGLIAGGIAYGAGRWLRR